MSHRRQAVSDTTECALCGENWSDHSSRCRTTFYLEGEIKRCLRKRKHRGACDFRPMPRPKKERTAPSSALAWLQ